LTGFAVKKLHWLASPRVISASTVNTPAAMGAVP
jgi:hypothetical protein